MLYNNIRKKLLHWHLQENEREMPWKNEKNVYKIWLSEIILQQTRVDQGKSYYSRFIEKYPSIQFLAAAAEKEVFKLWEGLGYYSRCANLMKTAKIIAQKYNGCFPTTHSEIIALPGIGTYTAAAICSFAYNLPYAVLDGNVYRVLSRLQNDSTPTDSNEGKKHFTHLAQELLEKNQPGIFNQAIMDFGATVCKPQAPKCNECILRNDCNAFKNNTVHLLPVKAKKLTIKERYFTFFVIACQNQIVIEHRKNKDIWKNLYQFPMIEDKTIDAIAKSNSIFKNQKDIDFIVENITLLQRLTHQKIHASFIKISIKEKNQVIKKGLLWVNNAQLKKYPFPKLLNNYLNS